MALLCSQCAYENPDQSSFCVRCGNRLSSNGQASNSGPDNSPSLPSYAAMGMESPASSPPSFSPPPISTYEQPASFASPIGSPFLPYAPASQSAPPSGASPILPYAPASQSAPPSGASPILMRTGQVLASLRRAFAGHGTLILHHSWLVSGGSEQTSNAYSTILDLLRQHNIVGLNVNSQRLVERGLWMEERDYLVARRGVSTMFIYVTPVGKDLYISRATTVLPIISNVRIAIFTLLFLIMFIGFFVHPSPYAFPGDFFGYLLPGFLSLLSIGILLFFIVVLIRSFVSWFVEKDFWVLLRPNFLNNFQLDDIMLLEYVTDDIVKAAVQQIGLDASQITPAPMGYQARQRIRTI